MGLCGSGLRQVTPAAIPGKEKQPPRLSRVNGWSLPLNIWQVLAWTTFLALAVTGFGIFVPLLPGVWRSVAHGVTGGLFLFHFMVHIIAVSVDPAEPNVRAKKSYSKPVPTFDRSRHAHVIQNQYCHLCEVTVSAKAKHCSACNKCVADFDHHCKWLNNCVGSRNYWCFLSSVASAMAGLFCLAAILLYVCIQYVMDQKELRTDPHFEKIADKNTWLLFLPFFPVRTKAPVLLTIGATVLVLDLVSLLLLGHLLLFHFYLLVRRLSTFDYVTQEQQPSRKTSARKKMISIQMGKRILQKTDDSWSPSANIGKPQELPPPPARCQSLCPNSNTVYPASVSQLKTAAEQPKETTKQVTQKQEENEGAPLGKKSSSLAKSFNLQASSIEIPPEDKAPKSLLLLCLLHLSVSRMSSEEFRSLLQRSQKPPTSMSTTFGHGRGEEDGQERVIRELFSDHSQLPLEGPGSEGEPPRSWVLWSSPKAPGHLGAQEETSTDLPSNLHPEPAGPSGPGTLCHPRSFQ